MSDKEIDLSVVIPAYNEEARIADTLLAVKDYLHQQPIRSEVIVVDDGSDTEISPSVQDGDVAVTVVRLERTSGFGAGRARNAGAAEASGDVLVFLDADMLVGPEAIERVARWFDVALSRG